MNKKELEAFAREAAKGIKTEKDLVDSSEQRNSYTKILICMRTFDETYKAHI